MTKQLPKFSFDIENRKCASQYFNIAIIVQQMSWNLLKTIDFDMEISVNSNDISRPRPGELFINESNNVWAPESVIEPETLSIEEKSGKNSFS